MSTDIARLYNLLTLADVGQLLDQCPPDQQPKNQIKTAVKWNKEHLIQALIKEGPYWVDALNIAAANKEDERLRKRRDKRLRRSERTQADRLEHDQREAELIEDFMNPPSQDNILRIHAEVHTATSNALLAELVCGVCGRSLNTIESSIVQMNLNNLPNQGRLKPITPHPAHVLIQDCLLEEKGCTQSAQGVIVNVCRDCLEDLKKDTDSPPKYSLANNLWVGPVPWQLKCLTIAEQLLIARIFPRVFVIKMFPRDLSVRNGLSDDQLQNALRGNVTTFELNSNAIADMINGNIMPQRPAILASVLSVTFVGRGRKVNPAALRLLRVRREAVREALRWLKENNPKYYGNINIDESVLSELPPDGIPNAIEKNM
ncbi:hypothetical protein FRC12_000130 [Ceratobasidium sp. 428]|nr:hypothetical protein FRC09_020839 [Ceratobasidium sp. 395]KAG8777914.1 hypothetical protein FRC12_000130 [Ceratobasidium sp. 428]